MAEYAIGDVQGCFKSLMALLDTLNFDESHDRLWFVGDLVNRGPDSLSVLRFVSKLAIKPIITLGNHDLHYLAKSYTLSKEALKQERNTKLLDDDNLAQLLSAPDNHELSNWLRQQKLIHYDRVRDLVMVHAGIPPQWSIEQALVYATEVEKVLQGGNFLSFFEGMYGNEPNLWHDALSGVERYRLIVNYLTRMRYLYADYRLNLSNKASPSAKVLKELYPWFNLANNRRNTTKIIFGHWASLNGQANVEHIYAIDTGCLWGGRLTAINLDNYSLTSVENQDL